MARYSSLVAGGMAARLDPLAQAPIQALDGIGGVQQLPHVRGEAEGHHLIPVRSPTANDRGGLGALVLLDPQPQHLLAAVAADAQGLVAHHAFVAAADPVGSEEHHLVGLHQALQRLRSPPCPWQQAVPPAKRCAGGNPTALDRAPHGLRLDQRLAGAELDLLVKQSAERSAGESVDRPPAGLTSVAAQPPGLAARHGLGSAGRAAARPRAVRWRLVKRQLRGLA